jgi:hypothetical protein
MGVNWPGINASIESRPVARQRPGGDALVRGGSLDIGAEKHDSGLNIVARPKGAASSSIRS